MSGIRISQLPGGLRRYVMELCAEHAAIVDAALEPLSAPQTRTVPRKREVPPPDTGETILDTPGGAPTKGLRTAVVHRDKQCSFPGCDRPPSWTRVHHVKHWLDGGTTCLLNAALLCEKHHLIVHRDGLTATVTATGVTWHV